MYVDKGIRKFRIALVTMLLMTLGYAVCQPWPTLAPLFPGYCMSLIAAAGLFAGSNVWEKLKKQTTDVQPKP